VKHRDKNHESNDLYDTGYVGLPIFRHFHVWKQQQS